MSRAEVFVGGQFKKEKDDREEAVRRVRNEEASLRDAIQEVQKKFKQHEGQGPSCNHPDSCVAYAIGNLCQSFLLAYGVRLRIGILLRAFNLAKGQPYHAICDLKTDVLKWRGDIDVVKNGVQAWILTTSMLFKIFVADEILSPIVFGYQQQEIQLPKFPSFLNSETEDRINSEYCHHFGH